MASPDLPARRSQHVAVDLAADGDLWQERIAVCESATVEGKPKLLIRSYYRNSRTNERAWDEPPSGASQIKHATTEMRHKAELQMQELQLTLEMIPDDPDAPKGDASNDKKRKKGGLFGRLRGSKSKEKTYLHESKDLNLQRAIIRSVAEQSGSSSSNEPVVYYDPESNEQDEALAIAKAMSMSESGKDKSNINEESEEEMLQRALEASRIEAMSNGYYDESDLDRKVPARSFDPYA